MSDVLDHATPAPGMPGSGLDPSQQWVLAQIAIRIIAHAPAEAIAQIGGCRLLARHGPVRDLWLEALGSALDSTITVCPASATVDRLGGGLDFSASIAAGRAVFEPGLLERADRGVLLITGGDRLEPEQTALIVSALDTGKSRSHQADSQSASSRFAAVATDESDDGDGLPRALAMRLGLAVALDAIPYSVARRSVMPSRSNEPVGFADVELDELSLFALARATERHSERDPRRLIQLAAIARLHAGLEGRRSVGLLDTMLAEQLVFGLSMAEDAPEDTESSTPPPPDEAENEQIDGQPRQMDGIPDTMEIDATDADIADLEALFAAASTWRLRGQEGRHGARKDRARRGRAVGLSERPPYPGARPDIVGTLRQAAPWQTIRKIARSIGPNVRVRPSDFRYRRLRAETETAIIFAVDASGSTALQRLGEAKGAVELLLAECYSARRHVSMIAFRGTAAELALPPTRALVRARKALAGLPGGGATPLASGLDLARIGAEAARAKGQSPIVVILSDGSGNVARDGTPGRAGGTADALAAAKDLRATGARTIVVDIGRRPGKRAADLAEALGADYWPMTSATAENMASVVQSCLAT